MKLQILTELPQGIGGLAAHQLYQVLDGPTLIHLRGECEPPLFVSVLLHGNEIGGWDGARALLDRYAGRTLPRSLSLLIGNVEAARFRVRMLENQPDYNRIWRGGDSLEAGIATEVTKEMRRRGVFASIDVHNNTGVNPHYAVVTQMHPATLRLARTFSRVAVYVRQPDTTQSRAFEDFCTTIAVESGRPGEQWGTDHVINLLETCLRWDALPQSMPHDLDLYHTVARVKVPDDVHFGFSPGNLDLRLLGELEHLNFQELNAGTLVGTVRNGLDRPLLVTDDDGRDVFDDYFELKGDKLRLAKAVVPSMFTDNVRIIRQDCLCYLMERVSAPYSPDSMRSRTRPKK
ncbi:MAG: M14 family metallopeptidase [Gammaproteobacteria bacterium]|nr:M14 family metallopeptidase [Gammaproteobacteria bacterium]